MANSLFRKESSSVAIEILTGPYDAIERMVADREADIGFVRLSTEETGFHVLPLIRSRMVCAMPADHPLTRQSAVKLNDLAGVDLVLIGRNRAPGRELDQSLRRLRPAARCLIEAHSVETACGLVAARLGVSIVPALIGNLFAGPAIELRPLADSRWHDYGVIARRAPLSAAATALTTLLQEAFQRVSFETELFKATSETYFLDAACPTFGLPSAVRPSRLSSSLPRRRFVAMSRSSKAEYGHACLRGMTP